MTKFTANKITVLRLMGKVDKHGQVFLPECHVIIPDFPVPVTFNHDHRQVIGEAKLSRKGNKIIADITVASVMVDTLEALRLMRMLTPSVEAEIIDAHQHIVLGIKVQSIALVNGMNADPGIKPLGNKVRCATINTREGLH